MHVTYWEYDDVNIMMNLFQFHADKNLKINQSPIFSIYELQQLPASRVSLSTTYLSHFSEGILWTKNRTLRAHLLIW